MISIIIPVYNAENSIKRAFDSLFNQTIGFENLEVILIDDNSNDDSPNIIQDYSNKYVNVKTIFLDKNSGSGGKPRNIGLTHATKDYVMFLDSDDEFFNDACEVLYREITSEDIDIVGGLQTTGGNISNFMLWKSILTNPLEDEEIRADKTKELLDKFPLKFDSIDDFEAIIGDFMFTPKIYKRSFLEENSINFSEKIIAEDSVFLLNALLNAHGIKYTDKIVYRYYLKNNDSTIHSSFDNSKDTLKGLLDAFYKMYYISLDKNKSDIFKRYLLYRKLNYFLNQRLLKSDLSVVDTLDLLIYASPLFKSCVDYNKDVKSDLFHFIADKDYENALKVVFGKNILNQKDIKVISDVDSFEDECHLVKIQLGSWFNQFESEKPNLLIFRQCENEEIQNYCNKNNIPLISMFGSEDSFRQLLDSIKFKYVPYLKHIVLFYELDDLCRVNEIHNHFYSINYPFKHLKLLTSKENLFLPNALLKSNLKKMDFDDNYYFCFADLNLNPDCIADELNDLSKSKIFLDSKEFHELIECKAAISIIVPVFNVENYLKECMDSILNQNFRDFEVICINDGSTDSSLEILKNYSKLDSRVKIISQDNQGLGAARNRGLKEANGKYILFVDSDDFLEENCLYELYQNIISNSSDMLVFKFNSYDETKNSYRPGGFYFEKSFGDVDFNNFTFRYEDVKKHVMNTYFSAWSKLYKKEFLDKHNLTFPEGITYEDVLFQIKTFLYAKSLSFLPKSIYNYRLSNENSLMHDSNKVWDIIRVVESVEEFLKESGFITEFKQEFFIFNIVQLSQYISLSESNDYFLKVKQIFKAMQYENDFKNLLDNCPEPVRDTFWNVIEFENLNKFENNEKSS